MGGLAAYDWKDTNNEGLIKYLFSFLRAVRGTRQYTYQKSADFGADQ
jgi:hypothetical protein